MPREANYHAIYLVLNDNEFFPASLRSIYDHISGATVITSYDRDRWGRVVEPDSPIDALLSRELDPERKVNVIAAVDVSEPALRNRAMTFAYPPRRPRKILSADAVASRMTPPDYFWIVDADEIYDERSIRNLKEYVRTKRANTYLLRPTSYFRTWNWRVEEPTYYVAVVTPGFWFGALRHRYVTPWVRIFQKLWDMGILSREVALRAFGARCVPIDVATYHHGNYVGDRDRIEAKLAASGHRFEVNQTWLHDVWDHWSPDVRNFHPHVPEQFPFAVHVATAELPSAIADHDWPAGWIEREGSVADGDPKPS
jgi:hypothetical protein